MPKFCWSPQSSTLRNSVRAIAILDLAFVSIPMTFETVNIGYVLGFVDPFDYLKKDCEQAETCSWARYIYEEISEGKWSSPHLKTQIHTYTVSGLLLFMLFVGIVEGYLFGMLRRGVREEIHHWCKKWFWIRLILLLTVSICSIVKLTRSHYNTLDGLYDLTKIYRIFTLIIVQFYMRELERTVGIVYIRPLREAKQGSLGQDIHLLD